MTKTVEEGNLVTLHYRGTLKDGTEFDSSYGREEPMKVLAGSGQLITGFEKALSGMTEGEKKTFTLAPAEAYGDHDPEAKTTMERNAFPEDFDFTTGMTVPLSGPAGQTFLATITDFDDDTVTADLNHPMAGKDLTFEVEVLEIGEDETTVG